MAALARKSRDLCNGITRIMTAQKNDFLEQDNNGSYNTHSSIGLEMTSRIPGT